MKLICPKCQAQYEIPDVAIPDTGRDVQCANCNETWFQEHPNAKPPTGPDAAVVDAKPGDPKDGDPKASDPKAEPELPRRELSPAVTDILRQEAAREKEARDAKAKELAESSKAPSADARPGRDRLPEISEIDVNNPRLNPRPEAEEAEDLVFDVDTEPPEVQRKTGFKRGFSIIVLLMGLALLVYVFAQPLSQKYPSLYEPLLAYVNAVNSGRVWLNDLISGLMGKT